MSIYRNTRGDTIIEVLLASVILSIVLAGAYSLSARATRINQAAFERTTASSLIQQQAELLRDIHNNDKAKWNQILELDGDAPYYDCRPDGAFPYPPAPLAGDKDYLWLVTEKNGAGGLTGEILPYMNSYGQFDNLYNIWITLSNSNDGSDGYYDFYIYSCWEGIGATSNQVAGLVVRLEAE